VVTRRDKGGLELRDDMSALGSSPWTRTSQGHAHYALDAVDIRKAHRFEAHASRRLPKAEIEERMAHAPAGGNGRTRAPWLEAIWAIAEAHGDKPALKALRQAQALYWAVAERHRRLGIKVARKVRPHPEEAEDVEQWAMIALHKAAMRWEPERQITFGTYATWWIRAVLTREIQAAVQPVFIPVRVRERVATLRRMRALYPRASVTDAQIAERIGWNVHEFEEVVTASVALQTVDLDEPISRDSEDRKIDRLADPVADVMEQVIDDDRWARVRQVIETTLPLRAQVAMNLRLGILGGPKEKTLSMIGEEIGVSRERVRQYERMLIDQTGFLRGEHPPDLNPAADAPPIPPAVPSPRVIRRPRVRAAVPIAAK